MLADKFNLIIDNVRGYVHHPHKKLILARIKFDKLTRALFSEGNRHLVSLNELIQPGNWIHSKSLFIDCPKHSYNGPKCMAIYNNSEGLGPDSICPAIAISQRTVPAIQIQPMVS